MTNQSEQPSSKTKSKSVPSWAVYGALIALLGGGVYLATRPEFNVSREPAISADASDRSLVRLGEKIFAAQCASCHGDKLEGQKNWRQAIPAGGFPAPPHDATGHTWHHSDELLFKITKHGGQAVAPSGFKSNMPGFGDKLSDREILATLAYIKSTWPPRQREYQQRMNENSKKK